MNSSRHFIRAFVCSAVILAEDPVDRRFASPSQSGHLGDKRWLTNGLLLLDELASIGFLQVVEGSDFRLLYNEDRTASSVPAWWNTLTPGLG